MTDTTKLPLPPDDKGTMQRPRPKNDGGAWSNEGDLTLRWTHQMEPNSRYRYSVLCWRGDAPQAATESEELRAAGLFDWRPAPEVVIPVLEAGGLLSFPSHVEVAVTVSRDDLCSRFKELPANLHTCLQAEVFGRADLLEGTIVSDIIAVELPDPVGVNCDI